MHGFNVFNLLLLSPHNPTPFMLATTGTPHSRLVVEDHTDKLSSESELRDLLEQHHIDTEWYDSVDYAIAGW
jgi:hypothetical protein